MCVFVHVISDIMGLELNWLRVYPTPFARAIVEALPTLIGGAPPVAVEVARLICTNSPRGFGCLLWWVPSLILLFFNEGTYQTWFGII